MAAKAWVCKKCGHDNVPGEPNFTSSRCNACNTNRYLLSYIAGAGIIGLILIVLALTIALGLPKRKYMALYKGAIADGVISSEEQKQLDELVKRYRLSSENVKQWEDEARGLKKFGKAEAEKPTKASEFKEVRAIPAEAQLNLQQGMNYVRSKDYENAIKEFTVAIEKYPNYAVAYSNRGVAYMQQKKLNKAMDDLLRASEIDPKDPNIHYNLVALYSLQNQLDRALDSLDKALSLGFNDSDALRKDPDLANLRKNSEFRKILEKHKVYIYR